MEKAFAVWITGLPASGKSSLAGALVRELRSMGLSPAVLESDRLREILTPRPRYDEEERERFYAAMARVGRLLVDQGVPVIFDATANLRSYRERAREEIARFLEVYVECPLAVCEARDPKGIYRKARAGLAKDVPGLQAPYEPPAEPDVRVRGDRDNPEEAAHRVVMALGAQGLLPAPWRFEEPSLTEEPP
jgi:adenylylsulfate kinase